MSRKGVKCVMRHPVTVPFTADGELVITADNSGAIGEKSQDAVNAPNQVVGYYACRVAIMECLAVGGEPQTVVMHNFTNDEAWHDYKSGLDQVMEELKMNTIPLTGSTESNVSSLQSGLGITVIGTKTKQEDQKQWTGEEAYAVIGTPLLGEEVIHQHEEIAPLWLFQHLCQLEEVKAVSTVGSKGIGSTWREWTTSENKLTCELDVEKSAGPATCFLIAFDQTNTEKSKK